VAFAAGLVLCLAAACGGNPADPSEVVSGRATTSFATAGCESHEYSPTAPVGSWIVDVAGVSGAPADRSGGEVASLHIGSVLREGTPTLGVPGGTVESRTPSGASGEIQAALAKGDRVVAALAPAGGAWAAVLVVSLGSDGSLVGIGACAEQIERDWQGRAASRSMKPAEAFLAWVATRPRVAASTVVAPTSTTRSDPAAAWWATSPAARQVDPFDTPKEVLRDLRFVTVTVTVPLEVLDGQTTLCARTALAVGSCSLLGSGVPTRFALQAYYQAGATDLTVELVSGPADATPSHVVGVVSAPRDVGVTLSGPSASQLAITEQTLAASGAPDTVIPSQSPPSSTPPPTR